MQSLLAIGQVLQRALADRKRSRELLVNLLRAEDLAAGCGQLDRQRQPIQRAADRGHASHIVRTETETGTGTGTESETESETGVGSERLVYEQLNRRALRDLVLRSPGRPSADAQLFLSPRTVEYHLRKVFSKLGIASRSELIRRGRGA